MTEPHIERFGPDVSIGSLIEALDRDGVAMVADAIPPELLSALNAEFDGLIAGSEPGTPNHIPMLIDFMGHKTHRIDGLPGKSKTFVELLQHPLALEMADHYLLPSCLHYLLSTAQLIEIQADETVQHLHRDDTAWIHPPIPTDRDAVPTADVPQLEVIVLYALCDFTAENGATRVVPGSHLWPARRKPQEHEVVAAEMKAGSAIYYVGKTLHGGGPNQTGPGAPRVVPRLLPRVAPHQGELLRQHPDRGRPRDAAAGAAAARLRDPRRHRRRRRRLPERAPEDVDALDQRRAVRRQG